MLRDGFRYAIVFLLLLLLLASCYLVSGERFRAVPQAEWRAGERLVQLVRADGVEERVLFVGRPHVPVHLDVFVEVEEGELSLEILHSDDTTAMTVEAVSGRSGQGGITVSTDAAGEVGFRLRAVEAYKGSYMIRYHFVGLPPRTPPPSPTPTLTPTP